MGASIPRNERETIEFPNKHLRVLGPPGSGKTSLLLERYRRFLRNGCNDPLRVVIVTYSYENARSLVEAILPSTSFLLGRLPVFRYFELAREVMASVSIAPLRFSEIEERLHMDHTLHRFHENLRSDYRTIYRSEKFQQAILELVHVLLQNGVSTGDLGKIKNAVGPDLRLADVLGIYETFLEDLRAPGRECVTDYDVCWRAAEALENNPERNPFRETELFLVDDFQDVDAGQFALLQAIAPPDGGAIVQVFGDPTGAFFGYRGTQHRILMEAFPSVYPCSTACLPAPLLAEKGRGEVVRELLKETVGGSIDLYDPGQSSKKADSEREILQRGVEEITGAGDVVGERAQFDTSRGAVRSHTASSPVSVRMRVTRNELDEVHTVAGFVKKLLSQNRFEPHEIAVVAREKHRYESLLSAAFHQHGIPLQTGRTRAGVLENFLLNLLRLLYQEDDEAIRESLQDSPFYPFFEKHQREQMKPQEGSVREGATAAGLAVGSIAAEVFAGAAKNWMHVLFRRFILPALREFTETGRDPSIYVFISRLLNEWERYIAAVDRFGGAKNPGLIGDFLSKCRLFTDDFSPNNPSPGRVGFYSCHEIKGRSFPAVCLVGCSEMIFPAKKGDAGFVPYESLQRAFETALPGRKIDIHAARSIESHLKSEFSLLLLALSRATETLLITAPEQFGGREETGPTSIVRDHLPHETVVESEEESGLEDIAVPPALDLAAHLSAVSGDVSKKLYGALENTLGSVSPVAMLWTKPPPERDPVRIRKAPISPSSLRIFDMCPRRYFYAKVLRLREEDTVTKRFGSLFHEVMRRLVLQHPSMRDLRSPAAAQASMDILKTVLDDAEDKRAGALVQKSIRHYLERLIVGFHGVDGLRTDGYRIESAEKQVLFKFRGWEFTGRIDRMDVSQDGRIVVLDYKTGKMNLTGATIRRRVVDSASEPDKRDWQIPVYTQGVLALGKQPPLVFVYYNLRPEGDSAVVSLFIEKKETDTDPTVLFSDVPKRRFGFLLLDEVERSMEDAVLMAEKIYSPRILFERTETKSRCRLCLYENICKRGDG